MHFVDRNHFQNAPVKKLEKLHESERSKWLDYKSGIRKNQPSGRWNDQDIKKPLAELFDYNCGYCGIYAGIERDGETDHHFPKHLDKNADHIYDWNNYVWSCHPCNNKKRDHYPVLNPCEQDEMESVYFHRQDGRYLLKRNVSKEIQDKYELTEQKTFLNDENRINRRSVLSKRLNNIYLPRIKEAFELYNIEKMMDTLQLNIAALTLLCRLFGAEMVKKQSGRILNVSSTAAFQAGPLMSAYYASKAYVQMFSEALNFEFRTYNVTVTALCPGPTRTEFFRRHDMIETNVANGPWVMKAEDVARAGFAGLMQGKMIVIPGFLNKLMAFSVRLAPRRLPAAIVNYLNQK